MRSIAYSSAELADTLTLQDVERIQRYVGPVALPQDVRPAPPSRGFWNGRFAEGNPAEPFSSTPLGHLPEEQFATPAWAQRPEAA